MLAGKPPTAKPSKKGSNADQALSRPANYTREPEIGSSYFAGASLALLLQVGVMVHIRLGGAIGSPEAQSFLRCAASHAKASCRCWCFIRRPRARMALILRPVISAMSV